MRRNRNVSKKVRIKEKECKICKKLLTIFEECYLDSEMCYKCDAEQHKQQKLF